MKYRLIIYAKALILISWQLHAQEYTVGVNTDDPNPNAVLHLSSPNGDQGLLMPRLSTTERSAMALTPADNGLMVYDETDNSFYFWNGSEWTSISNGSNPWNGSPDIFYDNGNVGIGTTTPRSLLQVGGSFAISSFTNNSGVTNAISGNFIGTNLGVDYGDPNDNLLIRTSGIPGSMVFMEDGKITFLKVAGGAAGSQVDIGDGGDVDSMLELDENGNADFRFGASFGLPDAGTEQEGMIRFDDGGTNRLQLFHGSEWLNIATERATVFLNNLGVPTANSIIGGVFMRGTKPDDSPTVASSIRAVAAENWDNANNGSTLNIRVTPLGDTFPEDVMEIAHDGNQGEVKVDGTVALTGKFVTAPNTTVLTVTGTNQTLPQPTQRVHLVNGPGTTTTVQDIDAGNAVPGQELILISAGATGGFSLLQTGNILLGTTLPFVMEPGDTVHLIYVENPLNDGTNYWMEIGRADK